MRNTEHDEGQELNRFQAFTQWFLSLEQQQQAYHECLFLPFSSSGWCCMHVTLSPDCSSFSSSRWKLKDSWNWGLSHFFTTEVFLRLTSCTKRERFDKLTIGPHGMCANLLCFLLTFAWCMSCILTYVSGGSEEEEEEEEDSEDDPGCRRENTNVLLMRIKGREFKLFSLASISPLN